VLISFVSTIAVLRVVNTSNDTAEDSKQ